MQKTLLLRIDDGLCCSVRQQRGSHATPQQARGRAAASIAIAGQLVSGAGPRRRSSMASLLLLLLSSSLLFFVVVYCCCCCRCCCCSSSCPLLLLRSHDRCHQRAFGGRSGCCCCSADAASAGRTSIASTGTTSRCCCFRLAGGEALVGGYCLSPEGAPAAHSVAGLGRGGSCCQLVSGDTHFRGGAVLVHRG